MRKLLNKSEIIILTFLIAFALFLIGGIKINPDPNPIVQSFNGCSEAPTIPKDYPPNNTRIGNVLPVPAYVVLGSGKFTINSTTQIYVNPATTEVVNIGNYLQSKLQPSTGFFSLPVESTSTPPTTNGSIYLTTEGADPSLGQEGYKLEVNNTKVVLTAYTTEGLFRGIQTIRQLLPPQIDNQGKVSGISWTMQTGTIIDYPRFSYRGLMVDVARTFVSVSDLEKIINVLAEYKINCLHIHLTDTQGWRLAINNYPNIVGGDNPGYYTQDEYKQLVSYAQKNYITVIPEIDMPGHIRNCFSLKVTCSDSSLTPSNATNAFIKTVLQEVAALTPGSYIHIGGDEYTKYGGNYPDLITLGNYIQNTVNGLKKIMIGWNDISPADLKTPTVLEYWEFWDNPIQQTTLSRDIVNGAKVIMAPGYPNHAYLAGFFGAPDTYNWDPQTLLTIPAKNVLGPEGVLWTDTGNIGQIFPNELGIAETGWSPQSKKDKNYYYNRLNNNQLLRLHEMGAPGN